MKKFRIIAVLAIAFCFLLGTTSVYAADGYEFDLTVSAGNGSIAGDVIKDAGKNTVSITTGDNAKLTIGEETYTVKPPSKKYFVRGMKNAGHDNNDEGPFMTASAVSANEDTEVVVAYGLKSNMIEYTISYVDQNGGTLLPSETLYGVIGDKPIVSYKYVEGYLPDAYNVTKTLTGNAADNVFTFTYAPTQTAQGQTIINNNANANAAGNAAAAAAAGAPAGNAAAAAAGAPGAAANAGTAIGDNATPLAINDQDTPLANPDEEEGEGGGSALPYIIGGVVVAAIIAAIAAFLARRRAGEEE